MKKDRNNYAFIDSQNLNLAIKAQGWSLDFKRFRTYLSDRFDVVKAFLFIGYVSTNQDLYTALQKYNYILIFKPTLFLPHGKVKGNVDAELVLQAMIEYPHYHKAVIASGDGDFYCLVNYLKQKDKLLKLIIPDRRNYSSLLRKFADDMVFMNGMQEKLSYRGT